jgi:hypothetical protein
MMAGHIGARTGNAGKRNVTVEEPLATARLNCFVTFTVDARSTLAEYLSRLIYIVYDATAPSSFEGGSWGVSFLTSSLSLSTDGLALS